MTGLGRTFEAVLVDADATLFPATATQRAAVRRRLLRLCGAGVDAGLLSSRSVAEVDDLLALRPDGPGRLLLATDDGAALHEVCPAGPTALPAPHAADPLSALLALLLAEGVGPGLVLVVVGRSAPWPAVAGSRATLVSVSDQPGLALDRALHLGGGTRTVGLLLDEQVRRREGGHVPDVDHDPGWVVDVPPGDQRSPRSVESVLSLSDGLVGLRGSVEPPYPREAPSLLADGVYDGTGPEQHLLEGPWPLRPAGVAAQPARRRLDLRTGVLLQESQGTDPLRVLRFVPLGRGGVVALRAEGAGAAAATTLGAPAGGPSEEGVDDDVRWARTQGEGGGLVAAWSESARRGAGWRTSERLVAYARAPLHPPPLAEARARLHGARATGFDGLLRQHRAAWAQRWAQASVSIPDDPSSELAARFALFHLWAMAGDAEELAIGARGLTGTGYSGHVFWDADVFVLPALVTLCPEAARAMLEYRLRRLPVAQEAARARGLRGARFPWESARDGEDVTPTAAQIAGVWVPILTGELEEHVVADVAWAACTYAAWSGDDAFLTGPGRPLLVETARYWAARVERDADGTAHLRGVIGPDEYHEDVDDNVFTNVLARWNLRRAAPLNDDLDERHAWLRLADAIVVPRDPVTGVHEQFTGFHALEPVLAADVGEPPFAADLQLGQERVSASQLVKQPDVLMAHHLVPDDLAPGSLRPDLDHYLPRTTHGSSLSPAVTAALLARAGRPDEALAQLDIALRLDLDDLTGFGAAGLHTATLGGVWQALVGGFGGVRVGQDGVVHVDPVLPARWPRLGLRFRVRGAVVDLAVEHGTASLRTDRPLLVATTRTPPRNVAEEVRLEDHGEGWEVVA